MAGLDDVPEDLHGSAAYRLRVGAAMVNRAWSAAVTEARDGTSDAAGTAPAGRARGG